MSAEFSRRVDVYISKAEPLGREEWLAKGVVTLDDLNAVGPGKVVVVGDDTSEYMDQLYRRYLDRFQPYSWHAKAANHEITCQGESYFNEADAVNAVELMFGDDSTVYWAPMYGEERGYRLLRYGKTDRDSQAGD
jgi:uncharacterized protein YegP (UPF0339 family)